MNEIMRFAGVLVEQDLGYGRKKRMVVDADTGEVIIQQYTGDVLAAFENGANVIVKELVVGREVNERGMEYITISDYECWPGEPRVLFSFWRNPKHQRVNKIPKHTGGKQPYLKVMDKLLDLANTIEDASLGALLRLARNINWRTGILIDKRTKKPLDFEGLLRCSGYGSTKTLAKRLKSLREAGAITTNENGYYVISRDLLQKG